MEDLYEYENLGVFENYVGSFPSDTDDNVDKTRKTVGMIFSSNLDRREVNHLGLCMLSFGDRPVCQRCCLALSFLQLLPFYY